MATIEKLAISGIRSFEPGKESTIEFYSPLTMIVGANGCGKTTIIECLKYACTGSLPPNVKLGQSFVNDPSITGETEVKGSIKLKFRSKSQKASVVVRSLNLTKKKNKLEFKALDGVVRTFNDNNEQVSSSVKCSDLDRQIPSMLGISAPIIENVMFCHQEESNWPMMEGAILKKKFDDVFESTRYAKALEAIAKTKKEYAAKAKDLKAEQMEMGAHLSAAKESERELASARRQERDCEKELAGVNDLIELCDERIKQNEATLKKCGEMSETVNQLKWKIEQGEKTIDNMRKRIGEENIMGDSDDQLKEQMTNFESIFLSNTKELESLQALVENHKFDISNHRDKIGELISSKAKLEFIESQKKDLGAQLLFAANTYARQYALPQISNVNDSKSFGEFKDAFNKILSKFKGDLQRDISAGQAIITSLEEQLNAKKNDFNKHEIECESIKRECENIKNESDNKFRDLKNIMSESSKHDAISKDFQDAKQSFDSFNDSYNRKVAEHKAKITSCEGEIKTITEEFKIDSVVLNEKNLNRSVEAELSQKNSKIAQDSAEVSLDLDQYVMTHQDALTECGADGLGRGSSLAQVDDALIRVREHVSDLGSRDIQLTDSLANAERSLAGNEALITGKVSEANAKRERLDQLTLATGPQQTEVISRLNALRRSKRWAYGEFLNDDNIVESVTPLNLKDKLIDVSSCISEQAFFTLAYTGLKSEMFKTIKEKMACPCCERSIDSPALRNSTEASIKAFLRISDMEKLNDILTIDDAHVEIRALENLFRTFEGGYNETISASREVDSLDGEISCLRSSNRDLASNSRSVQASAKENKVKIAAFEKCLRDLTDIRNKLFKVSKLKDELNYSSASSYAGSVDNRSIQEISDLQESRAQRKDKLLQEKDEAVKAESELTKRFNALKYNFIEKERQWQESTGKHARREELQGRVDELKKLIEGKEASRRQTEREKEQLRLTISEKENMLKSERIDLAQKSQLFEKKVSEISRDITEISRLETSLKFLSANPAINAGSSSLPATAGGGEETLADIKITIADIEGLINAGEAAIRALLPKINDLSSSMGDSTGLRRRVQDNIDLRNEQRELLANRRLQQQMSDNNAVGEKEHTAALRDRQKHQQDRSKRATERDVLTGKLQVIRNQAHLLEQKLRTPMYDKISERHRVKSIEFETTQYAVADIATYYDALDNALQKFHTHKINEINKIIRELWQQIYKGQDIEVIQLESGVDPASLGKASKSYNYRVVMRKGGDNFLDMRGRCSAGQKVLASIVIRLALAETFCLNCGILALDEPTTNLDEYNKSGLAVALAKLIYMREKQANFQLICITHDEEFVRVLKTELDNFNSFVPPEHYFRVSREESDRTEGNFFSKIERIQWEELL